MKTYTKILDEFEDMSIHQQLGIELDTVPHGEEQIKVLRSVCINNTWDFLRLLNDVFIWSEGSMFSVRFLSSRHYKTFILTKRAIFS